MTSFTQCRRQLSMTVTLPFTVAPSRAGGSTGDGDESEVVVRSSTDSWLVLRRAGGRSLVVAMEQPAEHTLAALGGRVSALADVVCPGVFLGM